MPASGTPQCNAKAVAAACQSHLSPGTARLLWLSSLLSDRTCCCRRTGRSTPRAHLDSTHSVRISKAQRENDLDAEALKPQSARIECIGSCTVELGRRRFLDLACDNKEDRSCTMPAPHRAYTCHTTETLMLVVPNKPTSAARTPQFTASVSSLRPAAALGVWVLVSLRRLAVAMNSRPG